MIGADRAVLDGFTITGGNADYFGGGIYCSQASPTIRNCTIEGNNAPEGGGMYNYLCSPIVTNCFFSGNYASVGYGGGMFNFASSTLITNCVFSGNEAGRGGGMYNNSSSPKVTNCTFSKNFADYVGGMNNHASSPVVTNCIFWGNTPEQIDGGVITYSDVQGGWSGTGNIDADPCFVDINDPCGPDGIFGTLDDGLRLTIDSNCIDAADGNVAPSTDILGHVRADINDVNNTGAGDPNYTDIGAYEFFYDLRIVVMVWIDESRERGDSYSPNGYSYFNTDLANYRNVVNSVAVVKSVCLVPPNPEYPRYAGDITDVLPSGCGYPYNPASPPEGISIYEFPRTDPIPTLADFQNDFNDICGDLVPDYVCLSVDNSTSMTTDTINPYDPDPDLAYPYDKFITWLDDTYSISVNNGNLIRRDGAADFTNERWVDEMRIQIQSVIDGL